MNIGCGKCFEFGWYYNIPLVIWLYNTALSKPVQDELSPNITAMVHHFNNLALLVPTEILAEATSQLRAKVVSTFIKVSN